MAVSFERAPVGLLPLLLFHFGINCAWLCVHSVLSSEIFAELRALGVRISMDDFGTEYLSLSYLWKFPFDKIKIDQSFVRQVPDDEESAAIVPAIITMGSCLGMSTTVEGVETCDQYNFSVAEGCDAIQGYLISKPLSKEGFSDLLSQEQTNLEAVVNLRRWRLPASS